MTSCVKIIQDQVASTMSASEVAIVATIRAIAVAAARPDGNPNLLTKARMLRCDSQIYWDFITVENSVGFYNPEEVLRILANLTALANRAQLKAVAAADSPEMLRASSQ